MSGIPRFWNFSVSQDGKRLAYLRSTNLDHVWLLDVTDEAETRRGSRRLLTPGTASYSDPSISPDGRLVAAVRDDEVYLLSLSGGAPRQITSLEAPLHTLSWSPDAQRLAFKARTADEWRPWIVDVGSGNLRTVGQGKMSPFRWYPKDIGWTADGQRLYYQVRSPVAGWYAIDLQSGEETLFIESQLEFMGAIPSPNKNEFAGVCCTLEDDPLLGIHVKSLEDGTLRRLTTFNALDRVPMREPLLWSEDDVIYFSLRNHDHDDIREIWTVPASGGTPTLFLSIPLVQLLNGTDAGCDIVSMTRDARQFVCGGFAASSADIWIADDFDPNIR